LKSIANSLQAQKAEIVILPPVGVRIPDSFRHVSEEPDIHRSLLAAVQRFRGAMYLADSAISHHDLTADGRQDSPVDAASWHVITVDGGGRIWACLRFLEEGTAGGFDRLWVRQAAIARSPEWGGRVRKAVESEMAAASRDGVRFGEVGGWAVEPERRGTVEALRTILATYGLLKLLGGCTGLATATRRHGSAPILRRIGLEPLKGDDYEVPAYYDPQYDCEMELLRYDSRRPSPKYQAWIDELAGMLRSTPVIVHSQPAPARTAAAAAGSWLAPAWAQPAVAAA
jgi:hypothetical protein